MQISSRFSVAVHTLLCVEVFKENYKVTSDFIAGSVGTNPVIIRKIMGQLKKAGLIEALAGTGGTYLLKKPEEITLLDIAKAVDLFENDRLFGFHDEPNPNCPVGGRIHTVLDHHLEAAQQAMEQSLSRVTLKELLNEFTPEKTA